MAPRSSHRAANRDGRATRLRAGFTLTEILVALGIIAIVAAIALPAMNAVLRNNNIEATRAVLQQLQFAAEQYEDRAGRPVRAFPNDAGLFDWASDKEPNTTVSEHVDFDPRSMNSVGPIDDPGLFDDREVYLERSIERFVWATYRVAEIRESVYAAMDEAYLVDTDGNGYLEVVDAWGNAILYKYDPDDRDTGDFGRDNFLPESQQPFFASAGPNQAWGDHELLLDRERGVNLNDEQANKARWAEDNLYSIDLDVD